MTLAYLTIEPGYELPQYGNASDTKWRSRDIGSAFERDFRITQDGRLEKKVVDRQGTGEYQTIGQGSDAVTSEKTRVVSEEWIDTNRNGAFTFHKGDWTFEARFVQGDLEGFVLLSKS